MEGDWFNVSDLVLNYPCEVAFLMLQLRFTASLEAQTELAAVKEQLNAILAQGIKLTTTVKGTHYTKDTCNLFSFLTVALDLLRQVEAFENAKAHNVNVFQMYLRFHYADGEVTAKLGHTEIPYGFHIVGGGARHVRTAKHHQVYAAKLTGNVQGPLFLAGPCGSSNSLLDISKDLLRDLGYGIVGSSFGYGAGSDENNERLLKSLKACSTAAGCVVVVEGSAGTNLDNIAKFASEPFPPLGVTIVQGPWTHHLLEMKAAGKFGEVRKIEVPGFDANELLLRARGMLCWEGFLEFHHLAEVAVAYLAHCNENCVQDSFQSGDQLIFKGDGKRVDFVGYHVDRSVRVRLSDGSEGNYPINRFEQHRERLEDITFRPGRMGVNLEMVYLEGHDDVYAGRIIGIDGGRAAEKGIQVGWYMIKINQQQISNDCLKKHSEYGDEDYVITFMKVFHPVCNFGLPALRHAIIVAGVNRCAHDAWAEETALATGLHMATIAALAPGDAAVAVEKLSELLPQALQSSAWADLRGMAPIDLTVAMAGSRHALLCAVEQHDLSDNRLSDVRDLVAQSFASEGRVVRCKPTMAQLKEIVRDAYIKNDDTKLTIIIDGSFADMRALDSLLNPSDPALECPATVNLGDGTPFTGRERIRLVSGVKLVFVESCEVVQWWHAKTLSYLGKVYFPDAVHLIVTLNALASESSDGIAIECTSMGGQRLALIKVGPSDTFANFEIQLRQQLSSNDTKIGFMRPDGTIIRKSEYGTPVVAVCG
eukprot:TRINITY_DN20500_c0_g1_i1.p1 TRINITY_DN20500_c0_g1~~TRINITY_DN20500_c0_g1_i1.p1  ORF type:complete len:895 (-),score=92.65 TRINITY_DN20500_c0_g1_i1:57-2345(-)